MSGLTETKCVRKEVYELGTTGRYYEEKIEQRVGYMETIGNPDPVILDGNILSFSKGNSFDEINKILRDLFKIKANTDITDTFMLGFLMKTAYDFNQKYSQETEDQRKKLKKIVAVSIFDKKFGQFSYIPLQIKENEDIHIENLVKNDAERYKIKNLKLFQS